MVVVVTVPLVGVKEREETKPELAFVETTTPSGATTEISFVVKSDPETVKL
jgi:hypothetical protein